MSVILGIDAAWTEKEPSGVALIVSEPSGWRCVGVAPSCDSFLALAQGNPINWNAPKYPGSAPDALRLLQAARNLAGAPVDIITIDMPVSTVPIVGRRAADEAISRRFGGQGCSTHSPSSIRPGPMGATLTSQFAGAGYSIATASTPCGTRTRLVEVYPHPALLALLQRNYRVSYKVSKSGRYWPNLSKTERMSNLITVFTAIHAGLAASIDSCRLPIPIPGNSLTLASLKRFEDALDALVCAWIGARYSVGSAVAYGDEAAAIWCPL
jgi:predicted RNase H-like nuclease